jgi:hypothetical protein
VPVTSSAGDNSYKDTDDGDMKALAMWRKIYTFCAQVIVRPSECFP